MGIPVERAVSHRRAVQATTFTIGGERLTLIAGEQADGTLGEVSLRWGGQGSAAAGLAEAYAAALSAGLAHGVPAAEMLRLGLGLRFAPGGRTDDPDIPTARSVADYLSRRLALDWLDPADRAGLGVLSLAERAERSGTAIGADDPAATRGAGVRSAVTGERHRPL